MRTLRSKHDRGYLWSLYNGRCAICGEPLDPNDWHADHKIPYHVLPETKLELMQPTCPLCNLKKGGKMPTQNITPRKHQVELERILRDIANHYRTTGVLKQKQIVEEVFPGGGKSIHQ